MASNKDKIMLRTSWVSASGNALLSIVKITAGLWAGSLAVLGDGIDSATDVLISVVMIFTSGIIARPPSRKFPHGYIKAESIATKILSLVIIFAGIQMLISTLSFIINGEQRELPTALAIYATLFSIAGKLGLAFYQFRQGRRIDSPMLIANAKNMRNDVVISVGVLLGLFFTFFLRMPLLDTVTGLIVSAFILKTGVEIFMDSNAELMDGVKDDGVYQKIFEAAEKVPGASNPHRVLSRLIGNKYMISLDIEADGGITLQEAHRIAHEVEERIKESVNVYDIVVHVEPAGHCRDDEKFGVDKNTAN